MRILAFESTAAVASVALLCDGEVLASYSLNAKNTHSTTLLPMAEHVLRLCGCTAADVDLFAVAAGPGSFTGIRIGVSTVKGLAFGTDKPCVGVSALAALAEGLRGVRGIVCPVMNARRDRYYAALFCADGEGITRLTEDDVLPTEEILDKLVKREEPIWLCGDGYEALIAQLPGARVTPPSLRAPNAAHVAALARAVYLAHGDPSHFQAETISPIYLRKTQAEREREERLAAEGQEDTV